MTDASKDWLREFPLAVIPESWALNDIFLEKLDELHTLFALHGYEIKLGSELEFSLESLAGVMATQHVEGKNGFNRYNVPALELLDLSLWQEQLQVFEEKPFQATLDGLRTYFSKDPDARHLCRQTKLSKEEALRMVDDMEKRLLDPDHNTRHRAEQDIFLAYLHTTPFAQGGIRDIVEPRFGPHEFGLGWYDMMGPEIRTPIQGHAYDIIETYHKYLHALFTQAPRFGFILNLATSHAPQFHISIWRKRDNKNMMLMKDKESVDFCEKALRGYCHALRAQPFLIQDMDIRADRFMKEFSISTSRLSIVRMEKDNFEIRRAQLYGVTHAARHLTSLIGGMAYGLFHPDAQTPEFEADVTIERRQQPVVVHRHGVHISAIRSTIEHCTIAGDGSLIPDPEIIKCNIDRLAAEIGPQYLNGVLTTITDADGAEYDLSYPVTWEQALKSVKYQGPGVLDTSHFENDDAARPFRAALNALEVKGTRTAFRCDGVRLPTSFFEIEGGISASHRYDFVHKMFTPYEQSEIVFHYKRVAESTLNLQAERILARYLERLNSPSDKERTPLQAMQYAYREIINTSVADSIYYKDATPFVSRLIGSEQPFNRAVFTGTKTYYSSMNERFRAAALGMMGRGENFLRQILPDDAENLVHICATSLSFNRLDRDIPTVVEDILSKHNVDQIFEKDKGTYNDLDRHSDHMVNVICAFFREAIRDPRTSTTSLRNQLRRTLLTLTDFPEASAPVDIEDSETAEPELDPLSRRLYNGAREQALLMTTALLAWTDKYLIDETPDIAHAGSCDPEGLVNKRATALRMDFARRLLLNKKIPA